MCAIKHFQCQNSPLLIEPTQEIFLIKQPFLFFLASLPLAALRLSFVSFTYCCSTSLDSALIPSFFAFVIYYCIALNRWGMSAISCCFAFSRNAHISGYATADLPRLQYSVNDFGPAAVSLQGAVLFFQAGTLWILV